MQPSSLCHKTSNSPTRGKINHTSSGFEGTARDGVGSAAQLEKSSRFTSARDPHLCERARAAIPLL
jgi:hypothetical protein